MARPGSTIVTRFRAASARPSPHSAPSLPPALPPSSRPTAELQQHHAIAPPKVDAQTFRQGWLVQTRLAALHAAGRIDREALDAALAWRGWFETIAPYQCQSWDVRVDASAGLPNDTAMILRTHAATRLRQAADALGGLRVRLLEAVVVRDMSWLELSRQLRCSDKTAVGFAIEALEALADWHAGRAVAAPPVLRFRNEPGRL